MQIISKFDVLPELIRIAYEGDSELLEKYHVDKFDLMGAVASTMYMIEKTVQYENKEMDYYQVSYNETPIGYVCTYPNTLYSFGINIAYRTKDILIEWWKNVKELFDGGFVTMLYNNNGRAINFCKRQGMEVVEGMEEEFVTLLNI